MHQVREDLIWKKVVRGGVPVGPFTFPQGQKMTATAPVITSLFQAGRRRKGNRNTTVVQPFLSRFCLQEVLRELRIEKILTSQPL